MWIDMGREEDLMMPGSAGRRSAQAIVRSALSDAEAGRQMANEHPVYGLVYRGRVLLRQVQAGEVILCCGHAVACWACGMLDIGPRHSGCACANPSTFTKSAGMVAIFGPDAEDGHQTFMPAEEVAMHVRAGVRCHDLEGRDITHLSQQIQ